MIQRMVSINIVYQGELHCLAAHGPSGQTLTTDAPVDNKGRGESFSPSDLVATALASCMATIMGMQADTLGIDITGMTLKVDKIMASDLPRRISALPIIITMPIPFEENTALKLKRAADTCPVHHSIHPDIQVDVTFEWATE